MKRRFDKRDRRDRRHDEWYDRSAIKERREMEEIIRTAKAAERDRKHLDRDGDWHRKHDDHRRDRREDRRHDRKDHDRKDRRIDRTVETYYTSTNRADVGEVRTIISRNSIAAGDFSYTNIKTIGKNDASVPFTIDGFKRVTFNGKLPFIGSANMIKPSDLDLTAANFDIAILSPNYATLLTNRDMSFTIENVMNQDNYSKIVPKSVFKTIKHNFGGLSPKHAHTDAVLFSDKVNQIDRMYAYQTDAQYKDLILEEGNIFEIINWTLMTNPESEKFIPKTSEKTVVPTQNALGNVNILYNKVMLQLMLATLAMLLASKVNAYRQGISTAENANADSVYNDILVRASYSGYVTQLVNYIFSQYLPLDYFNKMILPMVSFFKQTTGVDTPLEILMPTVFSTTANPNYGEVYAELFRTIDVTPKWSEATLQKDWVPQFTQFNLPNDVDTNKGNAFMTTEDLVVNVLQPAQNIIDMCINGMHLMVDPNAPLKPEIMKTFPTYESMLKYLGTQVSTIIAFMTTTWANFISPYLALIQREQDSAGLNQYQMVSDASSVLATWVGVVTNNVPQQRRINLVLQGRSAPGDGYNVVTLPLNTEMLFGDSEKNILTTDYINIFYGEMNLYAPLWNLVSPMVAIGQNPSLVYNLVIDTKKDLVDAYLPYTLQAYLDAKQIVFPVNSYISSYFSRLLTVFYDEATTKHPSLQRSSYVIGVASTMRLTIYTYLVQMFASMHDFK